MVTNVEPALFTSPVDHATTIKTAPMMIQLDQAAETMTTATATAATTAPATPGWHNPQLVRQSLYHPLEICHFFLDKHRLSAALQAVVHACQALSLHAVYSNNDAGTAGVTVDCTTLEQVSFQISLMQARDDNAKVVFEIQRRFGDSVQFAYYSKQIAALVQAAVEHDASAASDGAATVTPSSGDFRATSPGTLQQVERLVSRAVHGLPTDTIMESNTTDTDNSWVQAMEIAHHLVTRDRYDAVQLGLQSISMLTDCQKTSVENATRTAIVVLTGRSPLAAAAATGGDTTADAADPAMYQRLHQTVLAILSTADNEAADDDGSNDVSYYLALLIVANAVTVLSQSPAIMEQHQAVLQQFLGAVRGDFVHQLLKLVHAAQEQPHSAYLATRSLHGLCCSLPTVRESVRQAASVVQHAQQVGSVTHAALENESGRLLVALQV